MNLVKEYVRHQFQEVEVVLALAAACIQLIFNEVHHVEGSMLIVTESLSDGSLLGGFSKSQGVDDVGDRKLLCQLGMSC
jgi:hypothetical protein